MALKLTRMGAYDSPRLHVAVYRRLRILSSTTILIMQLTFANACRSPEYTGPRSHRFCGRRRRCGRPLSLPHSPRSSHCSRVDRSAEHVVDGKEHAGSIHRQRRLVCVYAPNYVSRACRKPQPDQFAAGPDYKSRRGGFRRAHSVSCPPPRVPPSFSNLSAPSLVSSPFTTHHAPPPLPPGCSAAGFGMGCAHVLPQAASVGHCDPNTRSFSCWWNEHNPSFAG